MTIRKILYGYQIQRGELAVVPQEAETVQRITTLYLAGASYQKISASLNGDGIPFSSEVLLWNKHKVKRLLENPRYTGADGYPPILDSDTFRAVQEKIREKTEGCVRREKRPALALREYLRCECGGPLCRTAGKNRRSDTLYLKCESCGKQLALPDSLLLSEASRQMAEHDAPPEAPYAPSGEVVRLTNAVNRGLERPDRPEEVVSLILQGVSARYDCCPTATESETNCRPAEVDLKHFGQAVSHITITGNQDVTVHFK